MLGICINEMEKKKMEQCINKKRIDWVDMAKGYGIILVIIGHLYIPHVSSLIYTFHMPLFFFLSGYVFKGTDDFKSFLAKKIRGIIVPYFGFGTIVLVFDILYTKYIRFETVDISIKIKNFIIQNRCYTVWFLTCLFCMNMIFYLLIHYLKNKIKVGIIVGLLAAIILVYYRLGGTSLPWNIDTSFAALPFFYLGYIIRYKENLEKLLFQNKKTIKLITYLIINMGTAGLSYKIGGAGSTLDMFGNRYGIELLTYISAVAGLFCIVLIAKLITINSIKYVGKNSLVYFALHNNIFIELCNCILIKFGIFQGENLLFMEEVERAFVSFIFVMLCCTLTNILIQNTKLRIIVGKT